MDHTEQSERVVVYNIVKDEAIKAIAEIRHIVKSADDISARLSQLASNLEGKVGKL